MAHKFIKLTSLGVIIAACVSFSGNENVEKSAGAPLCVTNAPGELTCSGNPGGKSCHSGGISDNSGQGTPSIQFSGGSTYVPGQKYTITPTISHPIRNRFGFEIVALKDSNNTLAGNILISDPTNTKSEQSSTCTFPDRMYVTHQLAGTYPSTPNLGQWTYQWLAPSYEAGPITFYAAFLAANNNNTNDPGDETYWTKITVAPSAAGIAELQGRSVHNAVYPNPCNNYVYLSYYLYEKTSLKAELISPDGKIAQTLIDTHDAIGSYTEKITLQNIPQGLYLIRSMVGKNEKLNRVYIE
jgi:hypothetical protein